MRERPIVATIVTLFFPGLSHAALGAWHLAVVWVVMRFVAGFALFYGAAGLAVAVALTVASCLDWFRVRRHEKYQSPSSKNSWIAYLAVVVGPILLSQAVLKPFVFEAYKIPSGAMTPTLLVGDHIVVAKYAYMFSEPQRGDIIVFEYPVTPDKDYVKRVIAVGGDAVAVLDNVVYVNGKALKQQDQKGPCVYVDEDTRHAIKCRKLFETTDDARYQVLLDREKSIKDYGRGSCHVPSEKFDGACKIAKGQLFVMGDNRNNSEDSRFWGTVPLKNVRGRVERIWLAKDLSRAGTRVR